MGTTVAKSFNGGKRAADDQIHRRFMVLKTWLQGVVYPCCGAIYMCVWPLLWNIFSKAALLMWSFFWKGRHKSITMVTWPRWPLCLYIAKTFKIFFFATRDPINLKHGLDHRGLKVYKVCINGDPELTLTYFNLKLLIVLIPGPDFRYALTRPLVLWFIIYTNPRFPPLQTLYKIWVASRNVLPNNSISPTYTSTVHLDEILSLNTKKTHSRVLRIPLSMWILS